MPPTASWLPVSPSRRSRLTRVGSSSGRDYGPGCAAASRDRKGFRCGGRPPHDQGAMLNGRRCPLNSSLEWPTFTDISPSRRGGEVGLRSNPGEGAAAILSLAETPPHPDTLPARGEREQNCSSLAGTLRGSRAHAYARNPAITSSVSHSPPRGGNVILTASCRYDSMLS